MCAHADLELLDRKALLRLHAVNANEVQVCRPRVQVVEDQLAEVQAGGAQRAHHVCAVAEVERAGAGRRRWRCVEVDGLDGAAGVVWVGDDTGADLPEEGALGDEDGLEVVEVLEQLHAPELDVDAVVTIQPDDQIDLILQAHAEGNLLYHVAQVPAQLKVSVEYDVAELERAVDCVESDVLEQLALTAPLQMTTDA